MKRPGTKRDDIERNNKNINDLVARRWLGRLVEPCRETIFETAHHYIEFSRQREIYWDWLAACAIPVEELQRWPTDEISSTSPALPFRIAAAIPSLKQLFGGTCGIHRDRPKNADALARRIGEATTVLQFFSARPLSARVLEASSAKRIIVAGPIGASVDLEAARRKNMAVYETPGLASASVAEYTIALALALGRRITDGCLELRSGRWNATFGRGLFGKTVGIVGLGRVGGRVAELCKAFSARVLAWSPSLTDARAAEQGVQRAELDDLAARSDVISLHMRLSPTTKGLFDARLIDLMRPTAFLINTARAGLVDGEALRQALNAHRIAGAALDVFDDEPIGPESPWLQTDNVLLSPHMAWMSEEALEAFVGAAVDFAVGGNESRVRRVV